jgi:hypothetical protein
VRPALRWLLTATLALSAVALWWPRGGSPALVAAVPRDGARTVPRGAPLRPSGAGGSAERARATVPAVAPAGALPASLGAFDVQPAQRDIFATAARAVAPAPPRAPAQGGAALPATGVSPPAAPPRVAPPAAQPGAQRAHAASPPPAPRYLGSMRTPQGERVVLLAQGDTSFVARAGLHLLQGFTVEAVEPLHVRVMHEASGRVVDIPVPPPGEPR